MSSNSKVELVGNKLSNLFPSIRIINLSHRTDRRREISDELRSIGLKINEKNVKLHEASSFSDKGLFPVAGARGCFHSHLSVLEEALKEGFQNILIFEDDCDFTPNINDRMSKVLDELEKMPWSIFYGGHDMVAEIDDDNFTSEVNFDTWFPGTHFIGFKRDVLLSLVTYLHRSLELMHVDPKLAPKGIDEAYFFLPKG